MICPDQDLDLEFGPSHFQYHYHVKLRWWRLPMIRMASHDMHAGPFIRGSAEAWKD